MCIDSIIPNGFARNKKSGKNGIKKKKSNSKKNGEDHTCLGWRGNQKTLGQRKKQTETNEYMVAQRKKKKN